jgi:hypothetical protein
MMQMERDELELHLQLTDAHARVTEKVRKDIRRKLGLPDD